MNRKNVFVYAGFAALAVVFQLGFSGCSAEKELENLSAQERYQKAMTLYHEGSYLDAYEEFRIVTLQYQASGFADSAQFLMGECRFMREEYLLAAYEYEVLLRSMPASKLVPEARYKRALCFYKQSPEYLHDQTTTVQAIDEFQTFIEYHPTDSLVTDAEKKITELNNKLARKEYENGITYMHMEYYKAASISFEHVLEKYHDTPYAEQAQLKKAEAMLLRNRVADAKTEIDKFLTKYPNSTRLADAQALQREILSRMNDKAKAPEKSPASTEGIGVSERR